MSTDKVIVLITGANSGIGYATALVLARADPKYHIVITGRNASKLSAAASTLESSSAIVGTISTLPLDVSASTSIANAASAVLSQHGRLDVLVNNAGLSSRDADAQVQWTDTLTTNLIGPALMCEHFRPLLLKSAESGRKPYSIFVSSAVGSLGLAVDPANPYYPPRGSGLTAYRASKAGLNMLAIEEGKVLKGKVKVFTVCPGLVVSNLRGESEQARTYGGKAEDPEVSGQMVLKILEGKRDGETVVDGKFVQAEGVHPW